MSISTFDLNLNVEYDDGEVDNNSKTVNYKVDLTYDKLLEDVFDFLKGCGFCFKEGDYLSVVNDGENNGEDQGYV